MIYSKVVEIAKGELDYIESTGNNTKYGEWFGMNNTPWCGIFVSWCYYMAGISLGNIGFAKGFAGCQFAYEYFRKNKKTTFLPAEGDIVFFDWNLDGRMDHCGIFVKWLNKDYFESIEGNTSDKNQSNGGTVMIKKRHKKFAKFVHV